MVTWKLREPTSITVTLGVLNKGRGSKFRVGSRVRQVTPEEGRRTHQPKRCEYNNKDEDNSQKTLNDKNHHALSQKFRQPLLVPFILADVKWLELHT